MTALDEERLSELRRLVPPVISPPISDVYGRAASIRRKRNVYRATGVLGVAAAAAVVFGVGVTGLPGHGSSQTAASQVALSCATSVQTSPLPVWARDGFTPPDQPIAHVTGTGGDIVGVLFGSLHAPTVGDQGNKILWVARVAGGAGDPDLKIHATLNGSTLAVDRVVSGGPGPSLIDVPRAGCWTFTLSWNDHQEQVAVPYS
jgi:hypothetical protein